MTCMKAPKEKSVLWREKLAQTASQSNPEHFYLVMP